MNNKTNSSLLRTAYILCIVTIIYNLIEGTLIALVGAYTFFRND